MKYILLIYQNPATWETLSGIVRITDENLVYVMGEVRVSS